MKRSVLLALVAFAIALVAVTCGCTRGLRRDDGYASGRARVEYRAAVGIAVICPSGEFFGSGVAITRRHVLTARHVIECPTGPALSVTLRLPDGMTAQAVVDALAGDGADVARLVVVGEASPLEPAPMRGRGPLIGETLCMIAADAPSGLLGVRKCGDVVGPSESGGTVLSLRVVGGNSGSPVYDNAGRVVAIIVARRPWPDYDHLGIAVPIEHFADLIEGAR